jgi:hypothetical protein
VAGLHEHAVARLGDQSRAAPFLEQVEEDAAAGGGDARQAGVELLGAVAVGAADALAGDA